MDHFDALRLFARVVERRSFTDAAVDLGLSRSTATETIRRLEARLGAKLLERTTRHVAPTLDGGQFYERCVAILADVEDAEATLRAGEPRGLLRVDAPGLLTRTFLLPALEAFLERHPKIDIQFGQSDRLVDLVREGVDCAIRVGEPADSNLTMRRLGALAEVTVASPAYLARHGTPRSIEELDGHLMVGFVSSRTAEMLPLEFTVDGRTREIMLPSRVTSNSADTNADLARLGFGLIQAPVYRFERELREGALVEVLPAYPPSPTTLSALFPKARQMAPRLRVFLDWAASTFRAL
ncbi:DNA-binding transcriptional LysR family regulator [Methylopila capsulata]|nr:LysR family transcriptional regulator [Methylopila capsulata]MBM7851446.1 DNA-binding transcriptional LysR family regulator [Methylopila capsulata]